MDTRSGFVALVGRPNVGKSTLTNRLVGQKISITTAKPQTTRHRIIGIVTEAETQIVLVDTPGLHRNEPHSLNRLMNRAAVSAAADSDLIVFIVEAQRWTTADENVLETIARSGVPVGLVINKIDNLKDRDALLPFIDKLRSLHNFSFISPISAKKGQNLTPLLAAVREALPESPFMYPEEQVTDRSERFITAEIIREKLLLALHQEIPYACTVEIESFQQEEGLTHISAVIWVAEKRHKAIVIGKGGDVLKRVGQRARVDLERQIDGKVFLETFVKVRENWLDDMRALQNMGFE